MPSLNILVTEAESIQTQIQAVTKDAEDRDTDLVTERTASPELAQLEHVDSWPSEAQGHRSDTPMTEPDHAGFSSAQSTVDLTKMALFQPQSTATREEAFSLSYQRAQVLSNHYALTVEDIVDLSPKFFAMHMDNIILCDVGAHALLAIQGNLVAGTLAPFARDAPQVKRLLDRVLSFEVAAAYMLTEVGHGLDAKNLETTVRLQHDGSFILHTPRPEASKMVPPSMPVAGIPRIAIVFAKLVVEVEEGKEEDRGIRPVIVALNDGVEMCTGITSRLLPCMSGIEAPYAITSFDRVVLPPTAVLGSLEKPANMRDNFFAQIGRIAPGTLSMSMVMIPSLRLVTYITGTYSLRRTVGVANKERIPIIGFRTQQQPILHALARLAVMTPFANQCIDWFRDTTAFQPEVRHGFAVILKTVFVHMAQQSMPELVERCGAQGLFKHNQICDADNMVRACAISEGDALVLSIRLAVELCLGKYQMPPATQPSCLLAQYEAGLAEDAWETVSAIPDSHRSEAFNRLLIPRCRPIILGIGHRMVYETALAAGVDSDLLALYELGAVQTNLDWYVEKGLLTRASFRDRENTALDALEPRLETLLKQLDMEAYVTAPIVEASTFDNFMQGLPTFQGTATFPLL